MPVQYIRTSNGVEHKIKWACGGCINGHRSKGCDHFSQWMIQVGLPGRPKAKCPHVEPPCTCKTKEKYLMVMVGTNADGECICQPYKAGQSREESTFMVPPLVEKSYSQQGPQSGPNLGPNPYDDLHNNGGAGVSESASENNNGGPLIGYQHLAYGDSPLLPHPLQTPPHSIPSQAVMPQACPQQCFPGNPAQGYLPHGRPQGSAQAVHPSWSSPSGYHPAPPTPNQYNGPTAMPLGQGHAYRFPNADPSLPSTPKQTPPGAFGNVHGHPYLSPGHQVLQREYQSYPKGVSPHTNSDQPFQLRVPYDSHGPVQEDEFIPNNHSLQRTFPDLNLNAPIDDILNPHLINGQQQEPHGPVSEFPSFEPSGPFAPSYDCLTLPKNDFDPTLANIQYGQHQAEKYQATSRSYGKCQCGPACNCVRCTTHPMNPATMEWVQKMYDTMDEDLDGDFEGGSPPSSRPQSSYAQPFSVPNGSGQDLEPQGQDPDMEVPQVLPMDFDGYSVLNFPISGCSRNADCRCGDNCRCEGCLTHSGHVKP